MKRYIFLLIFAIFLLSGGCKNKEDTSNRTYFTIPSEDRHLIVPVKLNDSVEVKLSFDTGGQFIIDTSVVVAHPRLFSDTIGHKSRSRMAWGGKLSPTTTYRHEQHLSIGNIRFKYPSISVWNWKEVMRSDYSEGLFNIPIDDSTHVWEINFASNYLEIHSAEHFIMPENTMLFPFLNIYKSYPNAAFIQLPLHIRTADGDTLTINRPFFIDTGMAWDIAVIYPTEESVFFNERNDAVWTTFLDKYFRHYTVNATLSDHFSMDSLRIYTFDHKRMEAQYMLGINFLKRFNVFLDTKNKQVGLQPINNYQRVFNPSPIRFYYSVNQRLRYRKGRYVINKMADYPENYYKEAGLQEGDELFKVNGRPYREVCHPVYCADLSQEMKDECKGQEFVVFDIVRNGKPMQIPVKINYNEQQGD